MDVMREFPESLIPGNLYPCFSDLCREGLQFCNTNIRERRCEYYNAHFHDCFTYQQQANCTQYCMDQWRQNSRFNADVNGTEINKYQIALFASIGIWVIVSAVTTLCLFIPRIRKWICSKISNVFKGCLSHDHCLSSGHSGHTFNTATSLPCTVSGRQHHNVLNTAPAVGGNYSNNGIALPAAAQNSLPNNLRLDADGISQYERSDRDEVNTHRRHTATHQRSEASTSNALRGDDQVPPAQILTKSKMNSVANGKKYDNRVKAQEEENIPFLKGVSDGIPRVECFSDDSATYAKDLIRRQSDHNDRSVAPHHELSRVHSSGYRALSPVYSRSVDTGYHSAPTGQGSGQ